VVTPLYNPLSDLTAVQNILISDPEILSLLDLAGKPKNKIVERIIKHNKWSDLANSDKRLCVYFIPSRRTANNSVFEEVLEIDCHVPSSENYKAWQVQERIFELLHKKRVNNRYLYAEPPLGELPTMAGFFCCGSRFKFYRII